MSIREALDSKQPRRVVVPIPVADVNGARRRLEDAVKAIAETNLASLPTEQADASRDALNAELAEAKAAVDACVAEVLLESRNHAVTEAIIGRHTLDTGGTNWATALPPLLAVLCVDESLRDQEWWTEALARPEWTAADVDGLTLGVMHLVSDVVRPLVPKG